MKNIIKGFRQWAYRLWRKSWFIVAEMLFIIIALVVYWYIQKTVSDLTAPDYISIGSAIISYIATTLLGVIAISQSRKANELSHLIYQQSEREFVPCFSVSNVSEMTIANCESSSLPRTHFCIVDCTPKQCQGYELSIRNYGKHPITNVRIRHVYRIEKKGITEDNDKEIEGALIFPNETYSFIICDTPTFSKNGLYYTFIIECKNDFGYSSSIELRIDFPCSSGEGKLRYTSKFLHNGVN